MKTCSYCGRDNDDNAIHCRECGTTERVDDSKPQPQKKYVSHKLLGLAMHETKEGVCLVWECPNCKGQRDFFLSVNKIFVTLARLEISDSETIFFLRCSNCNYDLGVNTSEKDLLKQAAEITKHLKEGKVTAEEYAKRIQGLSAGFVKDLCALTQVWKCSKCGEENPVSFDSCWNCGPQSGSSPSSEGAENYPRGLSHKINPWD
jgi:hypothetical protein